MNPTFAGLIAIFIFAISNVIAALIAIPGLQLAAIALFIGGCALTVTQLMRRENIIGYWRQPLSHYIFVVCGVGVYTGLLYLSFRLAQPFEANTLNYLWPILIVLLSGLLHREKLGPYKISGILMGFIGTLLIFAPQSGMPFFSDFRWGHLVAIAAAFIWAIYSVKAKDKTYPAGFMAPVLFVSALLLAALHFIFEPTIMPTGHDWLLIIVLGCFRVSYAFWDHGVRQGNRILLASISYFVPLISTLLFIHFDFVPERPAITLGAALIIIGCLAVNSRDIGRMISKVRTAKP